MSSLDTGQMTISARFTENDYTTIDIYRNRQHDSGSCLKQGFKDSNR